MFGSSCSDARVLRPAPSLEDGGYEISGFQPADAVDIPQAFEAVYGKDYLSSQVYDAAGFAGLVASGAQVSFIARDAGGAFAGHLALVFSAPNRRLVEVAQGIVLPAHRKSGIFGRLMSRAVAFAGGPAATLVQFLDLGRDEAAPCHLPASYAGWLSGLLDGAAIAGERHLVSSTRLGLRASESEANDMPRFDMSRLLVRSESEANDMPRFDMSRLLVRRAGFDFWRLVGSFETAAETLGRRTAQVLVSLGEAEGAAAVELLRGWGYACGGLLPGYLEGGRHVAIMYRSFAAPYFSGVRLHTAAAERLLARVVADWMRAQGLAAGRRQEPCDEPAAPISAAALSRRPSGPAASRSASMAWA
jgi:hypothetical protein